MLRFVLILVVLVTCSLPCLGSLTRAWKRLHLGKNHQCERTIVHVSDLLAADGDAFSHRKIMHGNSLYGQSFGGDSAGLQWETTRLIMSELFDELNRLDRMTKDHIRDIHQKKYHRFRSFWSSLLHPKRDITKKNIVDEFPRTKLASGWRMRDADSCGVGHFVEVDNQGNMFHIPSARGGVTSRASTVFMSGGIIPHTDELVSVVIKYANNCASLYRLEHRLSDTVEEQDLDSLYFEFAVMRTLTLLAGDPTVGSWRLAPRVFSLSQPGIPTELEWGGDFRFGCDFLAENPNTFFRPKLHARVATCSQYGATVRAMIEERVRQTLSDRVTGLSRSHLTSKEIIKKMIMFGIEIVTVLQELHRLGFIHGDVQSSNIALIGPSRKEQIVLIDFGSANFYPTEIGKPEFKKFKESLKTIYLSPWHLQNKRIGRRDDVFRALESIAFMIQLSLNKENIRKQLKRLNEQNDIAKMLEYKMTTKYFSDVCGIAFQNNQETCQTAMDQLDSVMNYVRSIPHVDDKPDYTLIVSQMEKSIGLLNNIVAERLVDSVYF